MTSVIFSTKNFLQKKCVNMSLAVCQWHFIFHTWSAICKAERGETTVRKFVLADVDVGGGWLRHGCWLTLARVVWPSPPLRTRRKNGGPATATVTFWCKQGLVAEAPKHKSRTSMLPSSWNTVFQKTKSSQGYLVHWPWSTCCLKFGGFRPFSFYFRSLCKHGHTYMHVISGASNSATVTTRTFTFFVGDICKPNLHLTMLLALGGAASKYIISIIFARYPHTNISQWSYLQMMNQNMSKHSIKVFHCAPELSLLNSTRLI